MARGNSLTGGNLSYGQKKLICLKHEENPKIRQSDLSNWAREKFRLLRAPAQPTISHILRNKQKYLQSEDLAIRRSRAVVNPELDKAIYEWVIKMRTNNIHVSGVAIKEQGRRFCEQLKILEVPNFSNGWLTSFQERYNLGSLKKTKNSVPLITKRKLTSENRRNKTNTRRVTPTPDLTFQTLDTRELERIHVPSHVNMQMHQSYSATAVQTDELTASQHLTGLFSNAPNEGSFSYEGLGNGMHSAPSQDMVHVGVSIGVPLNDKLIALKTVLWLLEDRQDSEASMVAQYLHGVHHELSDQLRARMYQDERYQMNV